MTIAVYPGTFDPLTNGHLDIARRAASLFERLIIAVYDTPPKNVLFSTIERVNMTREVVKDIANVSVESYAELTVNYAKRVGASTIVRGLRAVSDFEYEFQMAHINRSLNPDQEMVCLMTAQSFSFISSSRVKEVAALGGDVSEFVPPSISAALYRVYAERRQNLLEQVGPI